LRRLEVLQEPAIGRHAIIERNRIGMLRRESIVRRVDAGLHDIRGANCIVSTQISTAADQRSTVNIEQDLRNRLDSLGASDECRHGAECDGIAVGLRELHRGELALRSALGLGNLERSFTAGLRMTFRDGAAGRGVVATDW
jgi:hypothetical protein